jgi:hypothetical protein
MDKREAVVSLLEGDHGIWNEEHSVEVTSVLLGLSLDEAKVVVLPLVQRIDDDPPYVRLENPDGIRKFGKGEKAKYAKLAVQVEGLMADEALRALAASEVDIDADGEWNGKKALELLGYLREGDELRKRYREGVPYVDGVDVMALAGRICGRLGADCSVGDKMFGRGSALRAYCHAIAAHIGGEV